MNEHSRVNQPTVDSITLDGRVQTVARKFEKGGYPHKLNCADRSVLEEYYDLGHFFESR